MFTKKKEIDKTTSLVHSLFKATPGESLLECALEDNILRLWPITNANMAAL